MPDELQSLKDRLSELRQIPQPELKVIITMHNLEQMIKEREAKSGK